MYPYIIYNRVSCNVYVDVYIYTHINNIWYHCIPFYRPTRTYRSISSTVYPSISLSENDNDILVANMAPSSAIHKLRKLTALHLNQITQTILDRKPSLTEILESVDQKCPNPQKNVNKKKENPSPLPRPWAVFSPSFHLSLLRTSSVRPWAASNRDSWCSRHS